MVIMKTGFVFTFMHVIIFVFNFSLLVQLKPTKDLDVDDCIKEFAAKLSLIPSPPPGPLHLVIPHAAVCKGAM